MASREKRPLAPSRTKQKASDDTGLPLTQSIRKRSLPTLRNQQLATDFLEAVAGGSQISPKLESALPSKKVVRSLRHKQKLKNAKSNLIKVKVSKIVPISGSHDLHRRQVGVNKRLKIKKARRLAKAKLCATAKVTEQRPENVDADGDDDINYEDVDDENEKDEKNENVNEGDNETLGKSSKNNSRTKKTKPTQRGTEETESVPLLDKDSGDAIIAINPKSSPKTTRKLKTVETPESPSRTPKTSKISVVRRNASKERETTAKQTRSVGKDIDIVTGLSKSSSTSPESKNRKKATFELTSIDLTIEEVVASMVNDPEHEDCQVAGGKITRSRKMLIDDKPITDIEIKKEIIEAEDENTEITQETAIQLRNRSGNSFGQRSLRNGKLRQLSDSGIAADLEIKKRRWLNMDESNPAESGADVGIDNASDPNMDTEYSFSESSGIENPSNTASNKDDNSLIKLEVPADFDEIEEVGIEMENNNNSERIDRVGGEVGPILRSKTKAKSTEMDIKIEDGDAEEPRPLGRSLANQLEPRKSGSLDQLRKESMTKVTTDKPAKSRRSSLNIDVKKTMGSFYGNDKPENSSQSDIDLMIESIKRGIVKSIESRISRSEKSLVMNRNFEIPKIEEIVAPLSAESQKLGLDDIADDNKPNVSKNEAASNSSDNSVPKVADTAKEIEKLVMGDIELVDTRNSESANSDLTRDEQQPCGHIETINDDEILSRTNDKHNADVDENSLVPNIDNTDDNDSTSDQKESKKLIITRKSLRIKTSNESNNDLENSGKSSTDDSDKSKPIVESESRKNDNQEDYSNSVETDKIDAAASRKIDGDENTVEASSSLNAATETLKNTAETENVDETSTEKKEIDDEAKEKTAEKNDETEKTPSVSNIEEKTADDKEIIETTLERSEREKKITAETSETDASLSVISEDSETLESISKEVERLVSETTNSAINLPIDTSKNSQISKSEIDEIPQVSLQVDAKSSVVESTDTTSTINDFSEILPATINPILIETETDTTKTHKLESPIGEARQSENSEKSPTKENLDTPEISESRADIVKTRTEKNSEEQKSNAEENRRVLRARDKLKKAETKITEVKPAETKQSQKIMDSYDETIKTEAEQVKAEETTQDQSPMEETMTIADNKPINIDTSEVPEVTIKIEEPEPTVRTRRSREVKRRREESTQSTQNTLKSKRGRREPRRSDQRNKEESLLDDEVATINENNRSLVEGQSIGGSDNLRGFSEGGRGPVEKLQDNADSNRSKSENDIENVKSKSECGGRLSPERAESDGPKDNENVDTAFEGECKITKTLETSQKDSDDLSTSSESTSSSTLNSIIHETPEEKTRKESMLHWLGLVSREKVAERMNLQKAKKEQSTGTLKTVIRVHKNKDKKRSRSPLKMVLKQGRGDGDGDSPEFYTIQKEFGASGVGDSSSGANRKFSTNHRHSSDENNEEAPPKDRQSLVIPEKSASFSIHPGRCCADVCCHCGGKFGSLDTPMHLAQMKSDERRQKILTTEKLLNEDSCICDACYRRVDRRANTSPTNMQTKPHRQLMVLKCSARDCRDPARNSVKRRWLQRIKARVHSQVDINWESSQHTSIPFCAHHYSKILPYLMCALCKRRLAKNNIHRLAPTETEELNERLGRQGIPVHLVGGTFVCKHCRYFTQLQLKYKFVTNMNSGLQAFFKDYRSRMLKRYDVESFDYEDEDDPLPSTSRDESLPGTSKEKVEKDKTKKKVKCNQTKVLGSSKSPDRMASNSASEISTPEPTVKSSEVGNTELDVNNRVKKVMTNAVGVSREVMDLESTVEKLKKRKALEQHVFTGETSIIAETRGSNDMVEILAMDKEVTLTRLPKRARVSTDIAPVVQRLGANPSISVRTLFPGEEEMNLHANVEFGNVREITPQGWEKCATMIQYDRDTKNLWQELQRPYGNQSSFLRHLILLEKYYRSGDLILAPNASRNAINYSTSVQNRLISYEGPEKMDEPIMEPIGLSEFNSSRRLSGGYMLERDRLSMPGTSASSLLSTVSNKSSSSSSGNVATATSGSSTPIGITASQSKQSILPRVLKLNAGVSIIKKPPPSLQRLSLPSGSSTSNGALAKRKEQTRYLHKIPVTSGGKVFQLSEPEFKRLQDLKRQKQAINENKQSTSSSTPTTSTAGNTSTITNLTGNTSSTNTPVNLKTTTTTASIASQYQKAQQAAQTQFQKHLRMQQEMLNRQSRGDFEPLICDVRSLTNENLTPTRNLINNLNLPKSIQVTTKTSNPIPILPKIPKSLTVIPQTVPRPLDQ